MKCFQRLTLSQHPNFGRHQFAYRANRCTDDGIATALHTAPTHPEHQESYVRMLFIEFSSAKVIPSRLVIKVDFPSSPATVSMTFCAAAHSKLEYVPTSALHTPLSHCVLSSTLYSLYTYNCAPILNSSTIIKFVSNMIVVKLISRGD